MKVIYHLGVHCTDEQKLVTSLRANAAVLAQQGTVIPDPQVYRPILREVSTAMKGAPSSADTEETTLDAVMVEDHADRLIFSNENFLGVRTRAIFKGEFYPTAVEKIGALINLFPSCEAEIALAIRNPATFIPALLQANRKQTYDEFSVGLDPMKLDWAAFIGAIRAAYPSLPITVWCDEDTPLVWPEVLQALTGHDDMIELDSRDEILGSIMSPEGLARMSDYIASHQPLTVAQRRRVVTAFLDKYAIDDQMEVELDLPGWDEEYIDELTEQYDESVYAISRMPGVRLIAP